MTDFARSITNAFTCCRPYRPRSAWPLFAVLFVTFGAFAQERDLSDEYAERINSAQVVGALGTDLFGDQTNVYTGVTSFVVTDVSLPGNDALPVQVGRAFKIEPRDIIYGPGLFADWELDIPHLHGVFGAGDGGGWISGDPTRLNDRCSVRSAIDAEPYPVEGSLGAIFTASEYWFGNHLYVPGVGDQELLLLESGSSSMPPSDGHTYYWTTAAQWMFSCLPTIANGAPGEGFRARSPDGVVYFFDHLVKRAYAPLRRPLNTFGPFSRTTDNPTAANPTPTAGNDFNVLPREDVWLLPTRIEDRFGNWVRYSYDSAKPWQLQSITASDGRQLTLTYTQDGNIATVFDGERKWTYNYAPFGDTLTLTAVERPDGSRWGIALGGMHKAIAYDTNSETCEDAGDFFGENLATGTITHPSGAVGSFTVTAQRHGRSFVDKACFQLRPDLPQQIAFHAQTFDVLALTSKQISGPGLSPASWSFSYGPANGSWAADCSGPSSCPRTRTVSVTGPGEFIRYTFGNKFREDEGKLLRVERGTGATAILQSEERTYQLDPAGQLYPIRWGINPNLRSDNTDAIPTPLKLNVTAQQGATFSRSVSAFDEYANPAAVTRASSLGFSRSETITYHHNTALWVLSQVASVTDVGTGKLVSETIYDGSAQPISFKSFGLLKQTLGYFADGSVASVGDGMGRLTMVGGWHRGVPLSITFPDDKKRHATVDDLGQITTTTDELGNTTSYSYDAMGRLASLSLPGWAPSTFSFVPVAGIEFGIDTGHWRHTETTGSFRKTTYFDARFRPLLTLEEDTANAASKRYTRRAFDHENRNTFESYPAASDAAATQGSRTAYDALGRVVLSQQDGAPATTIAYLGGLQTRTTNPNGQATTVSYQAFDTPDTSAPVQIDGPGGVSTTITRDGFGMPTRVTRSGLYNGVPVSATRSYVYNANEQLCKRIEPEAGGTLFQFDPVGNLTASAEGQSTSLSCNAIPAGARISRFYDLRNRLTRIEYPNAAPTLYGYYPDGALKTLTQGVTEWFYEYNNRRLLTLEILTLGDDSTITPYDFSYSYTPLGHLAGMTTPGGMSGLSIDYAPNALGQPTKAGSFASGAQYYPDGSLKQFTYGNGIIRAITQNTRHLPAKVRDALGSNVVHDFAYSYDGNGNVTGIDDALNVQDRSLVYDARDRLVSATANGPWDVASYSYDPLDNLRSADQDSRQYRYQYDSNNRLSQLTDPSGTALPGLDFAYDAQGRQIRKGSQTRTFDSANRISAINGERYAYDGAGRRIATWAADGRTKVEVYTQNGQLAFAVDSQKGGGSSFVYLAGQRIAEDHWNCASNTHTASYFHADVLGSPVATTDAAGNVLERTYYAPYGEALNRTVDGPGYTGHVMDAATGLVYAQQRYYDPLVGKFLSIDPVAADPGTGGNFNRYWYANNNPYKFTDPDGRFVIQAIIGGVVGAVIGGGVELVRQFRNGNRFDGKAFAVQTGKGAVVGAITAVLPGAIATGALNFGSKAANVAVSLGNATAAGAAGDVASQALTGDGSIDAGQALDAGVANAAGLVAGRVLAAPARALSTTTIAGNPGLAIPSPTGRIFRIGAEAPETFVNETQQQILQDVSGETVSAFTDKLFNDK